MSISYLVLAYPKLKPDDIKFIETYRKQYDELYYNVVKTHFTIVFPTFGIEKKIFIDEIKSLAINIKSINFKIRCSLIDKNSFNEYWHTFLVPDEGFSEIVMLHDKLYSDKLFKTMRLDLNFIPHIGISSLKDSAKTWDIVQEINAKNINISGEIDCLDIVKYENDTVETLEKIFLKSLL